MARSKSTTTEVAVIETEQHLDILSSEQQELLTLATQRINVLTAAIGQVMVKDVDYGEIPGVNKPSLFKPGAEKLLSLFNYSVEVEKSESMFDIASQYIMYSYKASVKDHTGRIVSQCEGSVNSFEPKWRYTWVKESQLPAGSDKSSMEKKGTMASEFAFAIDKAETTGPYGKPAEYWKRFKDAIENGTANKVQKKTKGDKLMDAYEIGDYLYRVQNPDLLGMQNTIQKMAQKRAIVGAVLLATGASAKFTQDVEDMEFLDVHATVINTKVIASEPEAITPKVEEKPKPAPVSTEAPKKDPEPFVEPTTDEKVSKFLKTEGPTAEEIESFHRVTIPFEVLQSINACTDKKQCNALLHDEDFKKAWTDSEDIRVLFITKVGKLTDNLDDLNKLRSFAQSNNAYSEKVREAIVNRGNELRKV